MISKRRTYMLFAVTAIIAAALFLYGCARQTEKESGQSFAYEKDSISVSFFAFDTYMTITVKGSEESSGDRPLRAGDTDIKESRLPNEEELKKVVDEVRRLEKIFSATDPEAEVYAVNHRTGREVEISAELEELVGYACDINEKTGGALDITAYPLVKAWGFTTGEYRIPERTEIEALLKSVGTGGIRLDKAEEKSVLILNDGVEIDLGAAAKGYLSAKLVEMLEEMGVGHAILDLGGNIVTIGTKPDGSDWKVGIKDPFGKKELAAYVPVSGRSVIIKAVATATPDDDGNVYWHIIDPQTGYPAHSGIVSATIVGEDPVLCDALSTALFVMGEERAEKYYEKYGGFEYILVLEDGSAVVSEGLKDSAVIY